MVVESGVAHEAALNHLIMPLVSCFNIPKTIKKDGHLGKRQPEKVCWFDVTMFMAELYCKSSYTNSVYVYIHIYIYNKSNRLMIFTQIKTSPWLHLKSGSPRIAPDRSPGHLSHGGQDGEDVVESC